MTAPLTRYKVEYETNDLGFRGRDYALEPPDAAFRIACLGDSYTFGMGVREADAFPVVLQQRLRLASPDGVAFEVLNCGRAGYNTGNERVCYEREVRRYRPRVVVLQICINDFDYSVADLNVFPFNDEIEPNADGYRRCQAEVTRLAQRCRQDDVALAVVLFRMVEKAYCWIRIQELLTTGLAGLDVPILDLGVAFDRHRQSQDLWVHETDLHPNELAHHLAAKELERFLVEKQLLPALK